MTQPDRPTAPRRWSARRSDDGGFALVTTVLAMAVLAAFSLVVLQQTISNTAASRKDQDWVAALAAAQAGIDDYVSRLNDTNGGYYVHDTSTPDSSNPAMGFTALGKPKWAAVPLVATADADRGYFHYDVDNSAYKGTASTPPNGNLVVESTGRVGQRTRTLRATVRRSGFVDYVFFTDLETPDPLTYTPASAVEAGVASCSVSYLAPRPGPPTCLDVGFSGDRLTGPVHSNDTMLICDGNQFLDSVTTASGPVPGNGGKYFRVDAKSSSGATLSCGNAGTTTYQRAGDPAPVQKIAMPSTNLALKRETSLSADPRGCLFVGPTRITIVGTKLKVKSPWTRSPVPGCPADDTPFALPANGVVYVDVVPASNSGDLNAPSATANCDDKSVGFPVEVNGKKETDWTYPCRAGDVFISQAPGAANALDGRLTVSANNNLYVTGDIGYAGGTSGSSFLGLIAEQFLWFWHPVHKDPSTGVVTNLVPLTNLTVSASLLSLNHAIALQNPRMGDTMGTLTIHGALTQKYRGLVGNTAFGSLVNGYIKDYRYDQRLRYDAPPRFLNPLISSFDTVRTAEKPPAYR